MLEIVDNFDWVGTERVFEIGDTVGETEREANLVAEVVVDCGGADEVSCIDSV